MTLKYAAAVLAILVTAATTLAAVARAAQTAPAPRSATRPATKSRPAWRFAVSGDSRNCGDVVMPGIAAGVLNDSAEFYWHLGDFRAIYGLDEDIQHQPPHLTHPLTIPEYEKLAWPDFIDNQLKPFGKLPVFLVLGNHETTPPKTREQALLTFAHWFNAPAVARQRSLDTPHDRRVKGYYRWIQHGIAFYTLDNATPQEFDPAQLSWLERELAADAADLAVLTVVLGMHEALPDSIAAVHSMNDFPAGTQSGRRVYADLLRFQKRSHKRVYVLASHSHFFMDGVFNTPYLRSRRGVLPGWIVGTAGAVRYPLPPNSTAARAAQTNVYGYLLASVAASGKIRFQFKRLAESAVSAPVTAIYGSDFVHWCFAENTEAR